MRDSEDSIRTEFNTCRICCSSGRGYYEQDGNVLICQDRGKRFAMDQVEIESADVSPGPVFRRTKRRQMTCFPFPATI